MKKAKSAMKRIQAKIKGGRPRGKMKRQRHMRLSPPPPAWKGGGDERQAASEPVPYIRDYAGGGLDLE